MEDGAKLQVEKSGCNTAGRIRCGRIQFTGGRSVKGVNFFPPSIFEIQKKMGNIDTKLVKAESGWGEGGEHSH